MSPDVIKSLNAFADSLKTWMSDKEKWESIFDNSSPPLGCHLHISQQTTGFEAALEEILFYKPEIGKSLEKDYIAIVSSARTIDDKVKECQFPSIEKLDFLSEGERHWISDYLTAFQVNLSLFERKIRHIAKLVRDEFAAVKPAETKQNRKTTIVAIIISFVVDLVFELLVYFVPITWVKNHPNSYGLQGSIFFLIPCLIVGLFKPQYRKWCWGVGAIAFIVLLLSLMGGPSDSNVN